MKCLVLCHSPRGLTKAREVVRALLFGLRPPRTYKGPVGSILSVWCCAIAREDLPRPTRPCVDAFPPIVNAAIRSLSVNGFCVGWLCTAAKFLRLICERRGPARVSNASRDAVNLHLLRCPDFGLPVNTRHSYDVVWNELEAVLGVSHLRSQGLNSLSRLSLTKAQIHN